MPKSKELIETSDSDEPKSSSTVAKKKKKFDDQDESTNTTTKKPKVKNSNQDDDPPAKRTKPNHQTEDESVPVTIGPNGERLYEIGKMRFISVSQFKGKPYINIREYYEDNGVQKPGKKGISLPAEQWEKLKSLLNHVDQDLKKSK